MSYATLLTTTKKGGKIMSNFKETISQHFNHADEFENNNNNNNEVKK